MKLNFNKIGFKVAFFVQGYMDNLPKDDPNFVRWVIQLNECDACDNPTPIDLTFHKCTDEDYDSFYPPEPSYVAQMALAKKNKYFYCIDDHQDLIIWGAGDQTAYQRLDLLYLACLPDKKKGTCLNTTREATIKYLNPANLVLLVNQQRWDSTTFVSGEKNIIKNSVFMNT